MKNNQSNLECRIASLEQAISDSMLLISEIDGMDSAGSQEMHISQSLARCAYSRLQQVIRESRGEL